MRTPYSLPDDQCERLVRNEMTAVRMLLAALSTTLYAQKDLAARLECVPDGNRRMRLAVGGLRAVCDDLVGTITTASRTGRAAGSASCTSCWKQRHQWTITATG